MKKVLFILLSASILSITRCSSSETFNNIVQSAIADVKEAQRRNPTSLSLYSPPVTIQMISGNLMIAQRRFYQEFNKDPALVEREAGMRANNSSHFHQIETPEAEQFKELLKELVNTYAPRLGIDKNKHPKVIISSHEQFIHPVALPLQNSILVPFAARQFEDGFRTGFILRELAACSLSYDVSCSSLSAGYCAANKTGNLKTWAQKLIGLLIDLVDTKVAALGSKEAGMIFDICKQYFLEGREKGTDYAAQRLANAATTVAYYNVENGRPHSRTDTL